MASDLKMLCDDLQQRGFTLEADPSTGELAENEQALQARAGDVVFVWMPDQETIVEAEVVGDLPVWISRHASRDALDEFGGILFCGGMYRFMRIFVDGADISAGYNGMGSVPASLDEPL